MPRHRLLSSILNAKPLVLLGVVPLTFDEGELDTTAEKEITQANYLTCTRKTPDDKAGLRASTILLTSCEHTSVHRSRGLLAVS